MMALRRRLPWLMTGSLQGSTILLAERFGLEGFKPDLVTAFAAKAA
jgi:hypothetical protein